MEEKNTFVEGEQNSSKLSTDSWEHQRKSHMESLNIQVDVAASSSHCAVVQHPGLAPEAISSDGNPSLLSLIQLACVARKFVLQTPCGENGHCFVQYDMLTAENMIFMVAARFIIGDSSYDPDVKKFPLQVVVKLGHIGRTSLSIISTVNTLGGHAMITAVTQMVLIDRSTRRSTPLPEQWRQSYTSRTSSKDPLRVDLQNPPSEAISGQSPYVVTVAWSDTDHNAHTNFTSYIRFAVDAVHHAVRKGQLRGQQLLQKMAAGIREMRVVYANESREGDVLDVHVWELEDGGVVCSVSKDSQTLCQVTLIFQTSSTPVQLCPSNFNGL